MQSATLITDTHSIHPLHALLLAFPATLFPGTFAAGVTYARTAEIQWSNFAQWLNAAGLIFGALAGVAAVASYVKRRRSAGANHALIHGGLLAAALATGFIAALVLARDAFGSIPEALWWSGAAALFALAAAWIGFSDRRLS